MSDFNSSYADRSAVSAALQEPETPAPVDAAEAGREAFSHLAASGLPDGPRHQPWCHAEVPAGADRCPRCQVWQLANVGALKTGAYSRQALEHPDALAAMAQKREDLRRHVGQASVIQEDLLGDYATLDVLIATVTTNIAALGVLTAKGRARAAVSLLLQLLDRRVRYAGLLGLRAAGAFEPSATSIIAEYAERRARQESQP